jgi:hypothetical protein
MSDKFYNDVNAADVARGKLEPRDQESKYQVYGLIGDGNDMEMQARYCLLKHLGNSSFGCIDVELSRFNQDGVEGLPINKKDGKDILVLVVTTHGDEIGNTYGAPGPVNPSALSAFMLQINAAFTKKYACFTQCYGSATSNAIGAELKNNGWIVIPGSDGKTVFSLDAQNHPCHNKMEKDFKEILIRENA